jgi:flagellar P-ring protein precursor FlgI
MKSKICFNSNLISVIFLAGLAYFVTPEIRAERLKDLAGIQGVRQNQLIGYGLVVGLDGSGDQTTQTPFTVQSIINMMQQLGVNIPVGTSLQLKNVAAVMVTTSLPPFAQPGQTLDVTVSSIGNAKSLRGGTLLMTPLKGADNQIYGMAQGNVLVGGVGASANGSKAQINHLSVGRISSGATVERAVASVLGHGNIIQLELNTSDFSTASRVVEAINKRFGSDIVMNQSVTLDTCAISHGNLSIVINTENSVSQPNALAGGQTAGTANSNISIAKDAGQLMVLKAGASLADVVKALNSIGATPQDLLAILQAMKASGALHADLEII